MPVRPYDFVYDQPYHIYNRGANKQKLFYSDKDYQRFLENIGKYHQRFPTITFLAYCLLPNHFHFVLQETTPEGQNVPAHTTHISQFMNLIQQSYALYFNRAHKQQKKKKGPVFDGRFQARVIRTEQHLYQTQNYVEFNALKHRVVSDPHQWPYSSFLYRQDAIDPEELQFLMSEQFLSDFL